MQSLTIVQMSKYDCFEILQNHGYQMSLLANHTSLILIAQHYQILMLLHPLKFSLEFKLEGAVFED